MKETWCDKKVWVTDYLSLYTCKQYDSVTGENAPMKDTIIVDVCNHQAQVNPNKLVKKLNKLIGLIEEEKEAVDMAIEALKEQRPHGEWKYVQRGKFVDMVCPICGFVREDGIAYNMTVEEVLDSVNAGTFIIHGKSDFPKYCEECGAKMRKEGEEE